MKVKKITKWLLAIMVGCLMGVQFIPIAGTLIQAFLVMLKVSAQS